MKVFANDIPDLEKWQFRRLHASGSIPALVVSVGLFFVFLRALRTARPVTIPTMACIDTGDNTIDKRI